MTIRNVEINPQRLRGRYWGWGYALDVHTISSTPIGPDSAGHQMYDTVRPPAGEMLYQLKYRNDLAQVESIARVAAGFLERTLLREKRIDCLVPVPPSGVRVRQPVHMLAEAVGAQLNIPVLEGAVSRIAPTAAAKDTDDYDQRRRDQKNAFAIAPDLSVTAAVVLLFDDLYQSGATSGAVARVLKEHGGAREVCLLTVTKTRRSK